MRDTGPGIAADRQAAIFAPFVQGDASTTRRYGGTGLGLTISARLVEHTGGRIWVESEPGKGSTFHFTVCLPRSRSLEAFEHSPVPVKLHGLPVLVVDDNETNRRILAELLARWHMKPVAVAGAAAALAALLRAVDAGEPFGLVLLDCMMPGIDGFTLAERIKGYPGLKEATTVMLTSAHRPGDVTRCREAGIAGYLIKPVRPSELLEAIVRALRISWHERRRVASTGRKTASGEAPGLRILLAEDNAINQLVARHMLEDQGHTVLLASNGQEALAALERQTVDLVLMDVQMPGMDGFEATAAIREREKGTDRHLPIIALTAHAMKGDRERCLAAGMDGYLSKPIRPAELHRALAGQLPPSVAAVAPPVAEPPAGSALDRVGLLARVGNNLQRLSRMAALFRDGRPAMLQAIRDALTQGDAAALARAAHTLKGSVGNLGGMAVFEAAKSLEERGRSGDLAGAAAALPALEQTMERFQEELDLLIQEEKP